MLVVSTVKTKQLIWSEFVKNSKRAPASSSWTHAVGKKSSMNPQSSAANDNDSHLFTFTALFKVCTFEFNAVKVKNVLFTIYIFILCRSRSSIWEEELFPEIWEFLLHDADRVLPLATIRFERDMIIIIGLNVHYLQTKCKVRMRRNFNALQW